MNVKDSIDKSQRLVVTVWEGVVRFDDVRDNQNRLLADPDFDPTFDQLIDATRMTRIELSAEEIRIVALVPLFSLDSRRAIVATGEAIFGVGRMMEVHHEKLGPVHVFYSMEEALKWLGKSLPLT